MVFPCKTFVQSQRFAPHIHAFASIECILFESHPNWCICSFFGWCCQCEILAIFHWHFHQFCPAADMSPFSIRQRIIAFTTFAREKVSKVCAVWIRFDKRIDWHFQLWYVCDAREFVTFHFETLESYQQIQWVRLFVDRCLLWPIKADQLK